jgi:hypothetical protein
MWNLLMPTVRAFKNWIKFSAMGRLATVPVRLGISLLPRAASGENGGMDPELARVD